MSYGRMLDEAVLGIGEVLMRPERQEAQRKREYLRRQKPLHEFAVVIRITMTLESTDNIENIFADTFHKHAGSGAIFAGYQFLQEEGDVACYKLVGLASPSGE